MTPKKRGLGRGLDALLGEDEAPDPEDPGSLRHLPVEWLQRARDRAGGLR